MVKVRMAGPAKAYLRKEANYLRQYSPRAADAFLQRMREARDNLRRFPLMGFQKGGLPIPGMRSLVVDTYILDLRGQWRRAAHRCYPSRPGSGNIARSRGRFRLRE